MKRSEQVLANHKTTNSKLSDHQKKATLDRVHFVYKTAAAAVAAAVVVVAAAAAAAVAADVDNVFAVAVSDNFVVVKVLTMLVKDSKLKFAGSDAGNKEVLRGSALMSLLAPYLYRLAFVVVAVASSSAFDKLVVVEQKKTQVVEAI